MLDTIFVRSDAETGEFAAIAMHGDGAGRIVAPLLEFRLDERGYEPGPHEPSLAEHGIDKRPDFIARRGDQRVACEVEQFTPGASALERRLSAQRIVSASPKEAYGPIRKRVASAAKQLKPLRALELPLVVVLANTEGAMIDLSVPHVLAALYGNPPVHDANRPEEWRCCGQGTFRVGRDGKLTNDHPYLSAIALLRRREHRTDRVEEIAAEERATEPPRGSIKPAPRL